ncbi:hypothetical protein AN642_03120 [Epulopiscium sp. SCG-B10WGA-EpuloA2]|nr:hypothetical protein AN642_03120 [Epulopiscium sp. SCG-B10WGA-EpuloA2]
MNQKFKKSLYLLMASLTIGALAGCGGSEETTTTEPSVKEEVKEEPVEVARDLGGLNVIMAQWADVVEPEVKASAQEEATWEFRHDMMDTYNFSFSQQALGKYDTLLELLSTSSLADDPAAHVFRIHANFILAARDSGLLYDLATLDSIDLEDPKWSKSLMKTMTIGDSVYGLNTFGRPALVIFYNKRMFEEIGLDQNLLYDLQASGEWTWDKFVEISEKLTRDTDNDGVTDVYAINDQSGNFAKAAIFSNGGSYMDIDENGQYFFDLESTESMEAIEWCDNYWKSDYAVSPAHWDGHREMFYNGEIGMYLGSEWECTVLTSDKMTDDWGMVAFPKGPKKDEHMAIYIEDAYVIPSSFSKEEAEDIAFAYDIWTDAAPGYDGPEDWKSSLYPLYRDERAIEETMVLLRTPGIGLTDYSSAIAGNIRTSQAVEYVNWGQMTPAEAIESQKPLWQAEIDKLNSK